ncbi:FlgD immunoglobulin-like domain containing protein [Cohnella hashimotonis]|uniref:FlgD immunoglobulin-like domain containing protein n=1 Tax=Cohnella hashimotonis TaxID=2826895 RepID=A0ABT6TDV6_9BACL|nr:FlgD immunoglobulin-like domain containing protein [Cohnella hashimotonis]MDI4644037.1 FlgD immunoglobulin-like domain containing protein [Cohnella hashimotonis]
MNQAKKAFVLLTIWLAIFIFWGTGRTSAADSDFIVEENQFQYYNDGVTVADASALNGSAGKMLNTSVNWNITHVRSDFSALQPGKSYDVFFRIKVNHVPAAPSGNAFEFGVWDNTYGDYILPQKAVPASATQDMTWKEFRAGTFVPNAGVNQLVFFVAGTNNASQISEIYVDQIILRPHAPIDIQDSDFILSGSSVLTASPLASNNSAAILYNGAGSNWNVQAPIDGTKLRTDETYDVTAVVQIDRSNWNASAGDILGVLLYDTTTGTYVVPPKVYTTASPETQDKFKFYIGIKINAAPLALNPTHVYRVGFYQVNNASNFPSVKIDTVTVSEAQVNDNPAQSITVKPYKISPGNQDDLNDAAGITYSLAAPQTISAKIVDSSGSLVKTLVSGASQSGTVKISWDGRNNANAIVANGMYKVVVSNAGGELYRKNIQVITGVTLSAPVAPAPFVARGTWFEGGEIPYQSAARISYLNNSFQDLKDADMNVVSIANWVGPAAVYTDTLDRAAAYGIKVMAFPMAYAVFSNPALENDEIALYNEINDKIGPIKNHAALYAYVLKDEPMNLDAENAIFLRNAKRITETIDPNHQALIDYVAPEYTEFHYDIQRTQTLLTDPYGAALGYPVGDFTHYMNHPYYSNIDYIPYLDFLHMLTKKDIQNKAPWWTVVQNYGHEPTGLRDPIPAETRAMTYLNIGHGSKGFLYFIYQTESLWKGMVDENYVRGPKFTTVQTLLSEIKTLEPTLLSMTRIANVATTIGGGNTTSAAHPSADVTTHENLATGDKYLVVVNHDALNSANVTIKIDRAKLGMNITDITNVLTGTAVSYTTYPDRYEISALNFAAGDGKILKLTKSTVQTVYVGQDNDLTMFGGATKNNPDVSASDGKTALKTVATTNGWDFQWFWDKTKLVPGATYDLYAVVKIKYADDLYFDANGKPKFVTPTGNAFSYGVYDATTSSYPFGTTAVPASNMENMLWRTIKIGSFIPSQTNNQYAYIWPADNAANVKAVYVDKMYFVKQ